MHFIQQFAKVCHRQSFPLYGICMSYNFKLPHGGYGRERVNMIVIIQQILELILDSKCKDGKIVANYSSEYISTAASRLLQRECYSSENVHSYSSRHSFTVDLSDSYLICYKRRHLIEKSLLLYSNSRVSVMLRLSCTVYGIAFKYSYCMHRVILLIKSSALILGKGRNTTYN